MRVIKVGGRVQNDPHLVSTIARAWGEAPNSLVLVHGGGDEISTLQRAFGIEPAFVDGRRITSERDMDVVRMALSGAANKRLVAQFVACGVPAVGLSGEDAALIDARTATPASLGRVGVPHAVNARPLGHLLDGGYLPVLSPVSHDGAAGDGRALNVNGDDAAAAVAVALEAEELLLVADVPGVLIDGAPVPVLDADDASGLIARGVATGGMNPKLHAGLTALRGGVERVRIGGLDAILDPCCGTMLALSRSLV